MSTENQIVLKENAELKQAVTPMDMLQMAVSQGADLDKLEKLMALQERWEAAQAKKAFVVAMTEFKANPPQILKDMTNKQYDSKYSSLANFVNTVNPALSKHGLSANWAIDQTAGIRITCSVTHVLGHSESATLSGPPDTSGSKNPIQQIKSTITYLEGATFQAITGLVASDSADDDGNGAIEYITDQQAADLDALLDEVKANKRAFCTHFKVESVEKLPAKAFEHAVAMVNAKRNKK
jgi:hypothetical protein